MGANRPELNLSDLEKKILGISRARSAMMVETACVCLEDQKHSSGVAMKVDGDFDAAFTLSWNAASDAMRRAWADSQEATEEGACGIAALIIPELTEYKIVERARKGPHFDYWLGPKEGDPGILFQNKARLEISGIRCGQEKEIKARVKQKKKQVRLSTVPLPGFAAIVEFSQPLSRLVKA